MKKYRALFFIGVWVVILPFLGFPDFWRKILFVLSGAFIIFLSYRFRSQMKSIKSEIQESEPNTMNPFVDNIK